MAKKSSPTIGYTQSRAKSDSHKRLRTARKRLKRNREPKGPRQKDWMFDDPASWDEFDYTDSERIMPRDEGERRREVRQQAFQPTADLQDETTEAEAVASGEESSISPDTPDIPGTVQGLVLEVSTGMCRVDLGEETLLCHLRGALTAHESHFTNVIAVGDQVLVQHNGGDRGIVEAVLPRRRVLSRPDVHASHLQQIVAANVDQLLIVSAWREPAIWLELIDHYLVAANRNQLPAIICVNKLDLAASDAEVDETLACYLPLGYSVVKTSALKGDGLAELREHLQGRATVVAGLSGVGKSSLLTAIEPELALRVGNVSDWWGGEGGGQGKHTTTQATWLRLNPSTAVVDTPGIREFGISGLHKPQLVEYYPDIAEFAPQCRFHNCAHVNEPNCAVQQAVRRGEIAASRMKSYQKIYTSLPD